MSFSRAGSINVQERNMRRCLTQIMDCLVYICFFMFLDSWIIDLQAADYVSEDRSFNDEQQKQVKALRVHCWLNGAACSLKVNDFKEAIKLCSKVVFCFFLNLAM